MKTLKTILFLAVSWTIGDMAHGAAAAGWKGAISGADGHTVYWNIDDGRATVNGDSAYYDYLDRPFDTLQTNQYGNPEPARVHNGISFPATFTKRFYKTPAVHSYNGAGSVIQPLYMILPPEAYTNLPPEIKAIVPPEEVDISVLVTVVQDWADGGPLSIRPQHWNDPDAPYEGSFNHEFKDQVGIFLPSPPELRANGKVNELYPMTEITHGPGLIISSGNSDHLTGGYTHAPAKEPDLNLCFWSVVQGPTPTPTSPHRTAVTLHWVTSHTALPAIRTLTDGARIADWARHAEVLGIEPVCAQRLRELLGENYVRIRPAAPSAAASGGGSGAAARPTAATLPLVVATASAAGAGGAAARPMPRIRPAAASAAAASGGASGTAKPAPMRTKPAPAAGHAASSGGAAARPTAAPLPVAAPAVAAVAPRPVVAAYAGAGGMAMAPAAAPIAAAAPALADVPDALRGFVTTLAAKRKITPEELWARILANGIDYSAINNYKSLLAVAGSL